MHTCTSDCAFDHDITRAHLLHHVRSKIPTVINYSQIGLLPARNDFRDLAISGAFAAQVVAHRPMIFMPTAIMDKTEWSFGNPVYKIYMFGVLPCGSKTCVILHNIDIYADIMVPTGVSAKEYDLIIRAQLAASTVSYKSHETISAFMLHGFQKAPRPYMRFHFRSLADRKKFLDHIADHNKSVKVKIETASDDCGGQGYYFRKVARERRFATADWNRFEKYEVLSGATTNCTYTFKVDVGDFVALDKTRRAQIVGANTGISKMIDRDLTLTAMWDIETHTVIQNGSIPGPEDQYTIFMICSSYFWHTSDEPIMSVCAVDTVANARKGVDIVVICGDEKNVVSAHADVMGSMAMDILGTFNGGNFDWPLYKEKLRRFGLLVWFKSKLSALPLQQNGNYADTEENVGKWLWRREKIKIDATTDHHLACVLDVPGVLDTDVMPVFLKMYPRAEVRKAASLNFFLKENGIDPKADMAYKKMFRIYERSLKMITVKSCHCGDAQGLCACCNEHVKEIDYTVAEVIGEDIMYSTSLIPELLNGAGTPKCCFCGKKPKNAEDMAAVGYYCVIDCVRPQQLYVKRVIVPEKRELSTMSFVTLADSFYRADGMKVMNLIGSYCHRRNVAFSAARPNKPAEDKDHYPGGWVFPPNRGLHSDSMRKITYLDEFGVKQEQTVQERPICGEDFASLYPSIMMCNNISSDTVVASREEADALRAEGYRLHHIKPFAFERGETKGQAINKQLIGEGWTVRHNGIYNPKKDLRIIDRYETYIVAEDGTRYVKTAENIALMGDKHYKNEYIPVYGRAPLPGERMGIFAFIVKKLFDKRVPVKKEFVRLSELKEAMESKGVTSLDVKGVTYIYAEVVFNMNKVDTKQKALKVLANTFYGKSGEFQTPLYSLLVAAGITTCGQEYIKKVAAMTHAKGFITHYGDTDSLYMSCPSAVFADCDADYKREMEALRVEFAIAPKPAPIEAIDVEYKRRRIVLRTAWWEEQIKITMKHMNVLTGDIIEFLLADNGTLFMRMAYEEVGFPTVFCGKKKYFLTAHMKTINFYPKDLFIRGIEIIKQGQAGISKQLGEEFIREALSPENERTLLELAEDKIRKFYTMELDPELFRLVARYKPLKNNVPVLKFVDRMKALVEEHKANPTLSALYEPPDAGDKFEYVVVQKDLRYTLRGTKIDIKKGDKMEFSRVYRASQKTNRPMMLDLDYYVKKAIIGTFARFIAYHDNFQPPPGTFESADQYEEMDKYCCGRANDYLAELCDSITGFDKRAGFNQGKDYRAVYSTASKAIRRDVVARYGGAGFVIQDLNMDASHGDVVAQIKLLAAESSAPASGFVTMKRAETLPVFTMRKHMSGKGDCIARDRIAFCNAREKRIISQLYDNIPAIVQIINQRDANLVVLIENMRKGDEEETDAIGDLNTLSGDELVTVRTAHGLILDLIAVFKVRAQTLAIADEIERTCAAGAAMAPKFNTRTAAITESRVAKVLDAYEWA